MDSGIHIRMLPQHFVCPRSMHPNHPRNQTITHNKSPQRFPNHQTFFQRLWWLVTLTNASFRLLKWQNRHSFADPTRWEEKTVNCRTSHSLENKSPALVCFFVRSQERISAVGECNVHFGECGSAPLSDRPGWKSSPLCPERHFQFEPLKGEICQSRILWTHFGTSDRFFSIKIDRAIELQLRLPCQWKTWSLDGDDSAAIAWSTNLSHLAPIWHSEDLWPAPGKGAFAWDGSFGWWRFTFADGTFVILSGHWIIQVFHDWLSPVLRTRSDSHNLGRTRPIWMKSECFHSSDSLDRWWTTQTNSWLAHHSIYSE
jgi:hypothetical protein